MKKSLILGAALLATNCSPQEPKTQDSEPKISPEQAEKCLLEKKSIFPLCDISNLKLEKDCDSQPLNIGGLGTLYSSCKTAIERMEETCKGIDIHEYKDEAERLRLGIERKVVTITKGFNQTCQGNPHADVRRKEINKALETEFGIPPIEKESQ